VASSDTTDKSAGDGCLIARHAGKAPHLASQEPEMAGQVSKGKHCGRKLKSS
jgi:hypothetical protein